MMLFAWLLRLPEQIMAIVVFFLTWPLLQPWPQGRATTLPTAPRTAFHTLLKKSQELHLRRWQRMVKGHTHWLQQAQKCTLAWAGGIVALTLSRMTVHIVFH